MLENQIAKNKRRTIVLVLLFFVLVSAIGAFAGYLLADNLWFGGLFALLFAVIYAFSLLSQSTRVVMAMNQAREIVPNDALDYYQIVQNMAMVAQIPMPTVYIIEDDALNAFATGSSPKQAALAVTRGLLKQMNRVELEGVVAHEISHIKNYDIRLATVAVALVSVVSMIAGFGNRLFFWRTYSRPFTSKNRDKHHALLTLVALLAMVFAPLAASLVQLALSRQREYLADASAVDLTKNPAAMISALQKLDKASVRKTPVDDASVALYIHRPHKPSYFDAFFSTHPPISERIKRLKQA